MRMHPPGSEEPFDDKKMTRLARFVDVDKEYYVMKMDQHKEPRKTNRHTKPQRKSSLRNRLVWKS